MRPVVSSCCTPGGPLRRSPATSSGRSSCDPTPPTYTSGTPPSCRGRIVTTKRSPRRGGALDPLAPGVRTSFSDVARAARRYDVAARETERTLALEPGLMRAREQQALGDLLSGSAARCATLSLGPYVGVRAMCLHSLGRVREAAQIADSLRAAFTTGTDGDSNSPAVSTARGLAEYYAWTANAEESLAWLVRAYAISPEGEDFCMIASGIYDKVRNDPRFKAGLQRARTEIYDRVRRASVGAAVQ